MTSNVQTPFQALAARAEGTYRQRTREDRILIQVGSATCEHAAGSNEVLDEFRKHIAASGREDIVLRQTGCTGRCSREPIVGVFIAGQMPVKYERVDRNLVHEIFTQHVLKGCPCWITCWTARSRSFPATNSLSCGSARCGWRGRS